MEKFLAAYDKLLKLLAQVTGTIAGLLILACGFMIVYEVIARGVFNAPTEWVMELSTYCVTIAGFLGMAITYAYRKHIRVDILMSKLSPKACCYIEVFTSLAGVFYTYMFTVEGMNMVLMSYEMEITAPTTLGTPMWIPQLSMPVGMCVLFLHLVRTFIGDIIKIKNQDFGGEVK